MNPELSSLDEELFSGGWPRVNLSRSQKRMQRRQHQRDIPVGALDMSAVELQKLQETDPSLALPTQCRKAVLQLAHEVPLQRTWAKTRQRRGSSGVSTGLLCIGTWRSSASAVVSARKHQG